MKKKRSFYAIFLSISLFSIFTSTFFCMAAYIKSIEEKGLAFGTIGLRSYFHCGSGAKDDPYVITRPRHLFNLSRLQALGVFSKPNYFQLGYDLKNDGTLGFYQNDDDSTLATPYTALNMSAYDGTNGKTLSNIGNEATPFYGIFEGNGLTISNATVDCSLEDSGLFGYVASKGEVRNFLLDDVTIKNDGYDTSSYTISDESSKSYGNLYSKEAGTFLKEKSTFKINQGDTTSGGREVIFGYQNGQDEIQSDTNKELYNSTKTLSFKINRKRNAENSNQEDHVPEFSFTSPNVSSTSFSLLPSDDFFSVKEDGSLTLKEPSEDKTDIFSFFDSYTNNQEESSSITYPLRLSMSMSLVCNYLDTNGLNHSKVVNALNLSFELLTKNSTFLTMYVQPREVEHGNNVGLVIGHCDGSCKNVFVHDGQFSLNTIQKNESVAQNSMTGFIGLIGPSVHDAQSEDSKGNIATSGKDVGVLDFTEIYESIVGDSKFTKADESGEYYSYTPVADNDYMDFLRYKTQDEKIRYSNSENSVSLIGQKVIKDDDTHNRGLGVFSIATDYREGGTGNYVFAYGDSASIVKSKIAKNATDNTKIEDMSNIYFSTYEYNKEYLANNKYYTFDDLKKTLNNYTNPYNTESALLDYAFYNGLSIPSDSSIQNQSTYEAFYNYLFRFQLDSNRSDFYFSDLDATTVGGKFLTDYFQYKLTDEFGDPLEPSNSQFGVMVKDKRRNNIKALTTNFLLDSNENGKMYVFDSENNDKFTVSNSINFEIKTDNANVTILASNYETDKNKRNTKGSLLGIYNLDGATVKKGTDGLSTPYKNDKEEMFYTDPDYAMALVPTASISYFQYKDGQIGIQELGKDTFTQADKEHNLATNVNEDKTTDIIYSSYLDAPIFAHTFKLKKGRYCLGSALGQAHVYYICAQGQDEGDLSLSGNVYSSLNKVENVDFIKSTKTASTFFERKENTVTPNLNNLASSRCFLILDSGNVSHFRASSKNNTQDKKFELVMKYKEAISTEEEYFQFTLGSGSHLDSIEKITLTNYAIHEKEISKQNMLVDFFYTFDNTLGLKTKANSVRFAS